MRGHIDIESRSHANLLKTGVYVYAEHPTTDILMVCWALGGDPVDTWFPAREPIPFELELALSDTGVVWTAHNAGFERVMLSGAPGRRIGIPAGLADLSRWDCTAARAASFCLPRSLEGAGYALGLPIQKDAEGHRLMLRMCKPLPTNQRKNGLWLEDTASMDRLAAYCVRDVEVERAIDNLIPVLQPFEREVWELTERMNDRGVLVDQEMLLLVSFLVEQAEAAVNAELARSTNGRVQRVSDHGAITAWLKGFDADDSDLHGLGDDGVGKAALAALLARDDLPDLVRSVLTLRQENGKSSTAKYSAILTRLSGDGRVRGTMVYCGAASTGRWSSRGIQTQNLPRPSLIRKASKVEAVLGDLRAGISLAEFEEAHGPAMVVASELLRPILQARPGAMLARGDSKQIEARVTPWLAGAEWKLNAFRRFDAGTGPDLYKIAAAGIYHTTPDDIGDEDPRRQIGKVSELALGFQGGAGALQAMAKGYRMTIPHYEHPAGVPFNERPPAPDGTDEWIKAEWRRANPEVCAMWRTMDDAAIECMSSAPGRFFATGSTGLGFKRNGKVLALTLPGGRRLIYWEPRLVDSVTPWGSRKPTLKFMAEDAKTKAWCRFAAYGGLLFQNPVQAIARDLMAWWTLEAAAAGVEPVLLVHDEFVGETALPEAAARVEQIMKRQPAWAAGLPVSADSSAAVRYIKS